MRIDKSAPGHMYEKDIDGLILTVKQSLYYSIVEFELHNYDKEKFLMYGISYGRDAFECVDFWFQEHGGLILILFIDLITIIIQLRFGLIHIF